MMSRPRISFGIIVLNGYPFIRYNLQALYPFAHQIIVCEGASLGARRVASPDGHSRDGTLDIVRAFQKTEDPEHKVILVTAETVGHPDGFWPGEKDEQSIRMAEWATGDYLWQVDVDEFYTSGDMARIIDILADDPSISGMAFPQLPFWGSPDFVAESYQFELVGGRSFHRLFRWGPGYHYVTHRPPTVIDSDGRDLEKLKWLDARVTREMGLHLYHYCLLFPKQVREKCDYYEHSKVIRRSGAVYWANEVYERLGDPFRVHNDFAFVSWLERFRGAHPEAARRMWQDARSGVLAVELRDMGDVERLMSLPSYWMKRLGLKLALPFYQHLFYGKRWPGACRRFPGRVVRALRRLAGQ